ncbi:MAG: hypothetical protein KDI74_00215 [Gammaproteobacteria bacterium]|nr:hypothetical protein [Gammaproteobacteria bacterium]HXK56366.1 hypothetical protein [Gammaproteobacteria bacterium]
MISLVTLAHRASSIHNRYATIHSAVFACSITQMKISFWKRVKPDYCQYESDLVQLCDQLADIRSVIEREDEVEMANTVSREFAFALDVYVIALSDAVMSLSTICGRRCREGRGIEPYSDTQNRADRHEYDNLIQQYRRLGERLGQLFRRL